MTDFALTTTTTTDPDISAAMTVYERLAPLQDALGLANLTLSEMHLFAMVAHHTGLDPFTKQIYAIKRGGKVIHQTGIDGYRSTAERTSQYRGSDAPEFEPCDCDDKDSPALHPKVARVTVYRAYPDGIRGQVGEARWHELKPKHTKGTYGYADDMWWQMPANQLAKCAEANGLRKAFPRVLGGVYISEEMEQGGPGEAPGLVEAASQPTARERIAARRHVIEQPSVANATRPPDDTTADDDTASDDATWAAAAALVTGAPPLTELSTAAFQALREQHEIAGTDVATLAREMFPAAPGLAALSDTDRAALWLALEARPVAAATA